LSVTRSPCGEGKGYEKSAEIRLREKANIRFIDWAETLFEQGMEVGVYIVVGSFASQVIEAAEKESVDLIVLSPERKGRLETALFRVRHYRDRPPFRHPCAGIQISLPQGAAGGESL
jgi:hypothetical protein